MSTVVHFHCHHWRRHLAYANLAAWSLLERGKVEPGQICATLTEELAGTPEAEGLRRLGVTLLYSITGWQAKLIAVNSVFNLFEDVDTIIQLDTDTVLTESMDFIARLEGMTRGADYAAYLPSNQTGTLRNADDGSMQFSFRTGLFLPDFNPAHKEGALRLHALTVGLLGLDWFRFVNGLTGWIHGGLTVYKRTIRESQAWRAMQALAWVTHCDETIMQMVRACGSNSHGARFRPLDHAQLPHRVCPDFLNLRQGLGMVHYAGDWYRESTPINRNIIATALWEAMGIKLPTDGPVRPHGGPPRHFEGPGGIQ